jgi:hypothetical protein
MVYFEKCISLVFLSSYKSRVFENKCVCVCVCVYIYIYIYRVSHELRSLLREGVPYVKLYQYNPKHLYLKINRYRDNGQIKVWSSWRCTHYNRSADPKPCPSLRGVSCYGISAYGSQGSGVLECSWHAGGVASDSRAVVSCCDDCV